MTRTVALVLACAAAVALLAACSSDNPSTSRSTTSAPGSTASVVTAVTATVPPVPAGVEDCGTQNDLAGWPTTMLASADAFACIEDALATGTPAQMSSITASDGESGRTTDDGYDVPTRKIVTWVVTGAGQVEETIDRTEDGGTRTTATCAGFTEPSIGVPIAGTACS